MINLRHIDLEQALGESIMTIFRMFWLHGPSAVYKTTTQPTNTYDAVKTSCNLLQSVVLDSVTYLLKVAFVILITW